MKYDKYERQAIKSLSDSASLLFQEIEREEKGKIVGVPTLCSALKKDQKFVLFSCLSGNGKTEELGMDLGVLFTTRLRRRAEGFIKNLRDAGYSGSPLVIIDDTEPRGVWGWEICQRDISAWYRMVIEDSEIPSGWGVALWSSVARDAEDKEYYSSFRTLDEVYEKVSQVSSNSLLLYQLFDHMKKFPNKKLKRDIDLRAAALRRLVHYESQGSILGQMIPNAILIQTEIPWSVKDPLYHPRDNSIAIIHPFPEERR